MAGYWQLMLMVLLGGINYENLYVISVLVALTTDSGKILAKLHAVQPKGELQLLSGIKIAHLALKHRLGKNHKTRIVMFVGSPINVEEKELVKVAKKLNNNRAAKVQ